MLTLDAITIAAPDPAEVKAFYESGLGAVVVADHGEFVTYDLGPAAPALGVYGGDALAADAGVPADGSGFRGVTLSYIVDTADQVDEMIASAVAAGGSIVTPARNAMWGGYSGHVADPAGHLWKIVSSRRRPWIGGNRGAAASAASTLGRTAREVVVTIGANDVRRTKSFYERGLGVSVEKAYRKFVSFQPGEVAGGMALYEWGALADDAGVPADGTGFRGFTLSHTADSAAQVDTIMQAAEAAGARVVKPAEAAAWGGYAGYFADPDGCLWKVAAAS